MDEERLSQLYNLIINPGTRDWERSQLLAARDRLESGQEQKNVLSELEAALRPLALRGNLTPDLQDFYDQLRGIETTQTTQKQRHIKSLTGVIKKQPFLRGLFWCMVEPFEQKTGITSVLFRIYRQGISRIPRTIKSVAG